MIPIIDSLRFFSDSFDYTKEALWGRWIRWLLLLSNVIISPLIYGYSVRVMSGAKPAPEPEGWIQAFSRRHQTDHHHGRLRHSGAGRLRTTPQP